MHEAHAQKHKDTVLWAFPITDYMVKLNDSVTVVQVELPQQVHFILDKQPGLLRGIYRDNAADTGRKGFGKCHLIKGAFNYFSIRIDKSKKPQKGDLIYTFIPAPVNGYQSPLFFCALQNITFLSVQDSAFYTPDNFLLRRTHLQDDKLLDKMVEDIRFTGHYFLQNDSTMNKPIEAGKLKGNGVLTEMIHAVKDDLIHFLQYVAVRNANYAGNTWKISETYATWLLAGAPEVVEN